MASAGAQHEAHHTEQLVADAGALMERVDRHGVGGPLTEQDLLVWVERGVSEELHAGGKVRLLESGVVLHKPRSQPRIQAGNGRIHSASRPASKRSTSSRSL